MQEGTQTPQINVSKIAAGGGIAGALFAIISMVIFLIGIPALRYFLLAAIVLGCGVALLIHFIRPETPGKSWILSAAEKTDSSARQGEPQNPSTNVSGITDPLLAFTS
jgi:hypothetical protein